MGGAQQLRDEELLRALYLQHAPLLLAFVQRLMNGDRATAEDIVQETLLRAWRHSDQLSAEGVRPWLFTTARRLVVDTARARSARPREAPAAELAAVSTGDSVDAALNAAVVMDALRALSPAHREILIDYFYRGRTAAEIAVERGLPAGTARSRVYYALRAMRLALQERGVDGP
ncbi:MAG TPA: sigma-70 family RNA polymerase sigma factor [Jatrophihabitans sp.]|nr:sigma-70 family RNA polymerase sigma factor [Jatrophihabitans sp.]